MRSSFLLASLRAVPLYCPPRMRGCPARVRGGNQGCVNRKLRPSPQWEAVGNDLNSPVILVNVEVNDSGVGGHPGSCFLANSGCCSLEGASSTA